MISLYKKVGFALLVSIFWMTGMAQAVTFDVNELRAIIGGNDLVQVDKAIIFDASPSFIPDKTQPVRYRWDLGDGSLRSEEEIVHTYKKPGQYEISLTLRQGVDESTARRTIFVYKKLALLLTDVTGEKEAINAFVEEARAQGIFINVIESFDSTTAFMSEEALSKKLADQVDLLSAADYIAIWTDRGSGINALTRLGRERPEIQETMREKTIVVISDENLGNLGRIMQSNFAIIQPKQIILTRQQKLADLVASESPEEFLQKLDRSIAEYKIIDAKTGRVRLWNVISYLVTFMIANGVPSNTIVLLLMLPLIATIITFMKQVIGITTFGLYTPSIITLVFLALGLKFGLLILFIILLSGALMRKVLDHFPLLNTPRIAIILIMSTFIILLTIAFGTYLNISQIATLAVFPMLIMTTLAEKFGSALGGKGFYPALLLMLEITGISLLCYWVVEWQVMQTLMLGRPEIIFLLLLINILLGRWTGLRVLEYVRFRELMKHTEEE